MRFEGDDGVADADCRRALAEREKYIYISKNKYIIESPKKGLWLQISTVTHLFLPAASFLAVPGELAAFLGDMTRCSAAAFLALLVFTEELDGDLGVWIDNQDVIQLDEIVFMVQAVQ